LIIRFISLLLTFWNDSNNDVETFDISLSKIFYDSLDKLDFFFENKFSIFWVTVSCLSPKRLQYFRHVEGRTFLINIPEISDIKSNVLQVKNNRDFRLESIKII